MPAHPTMSPRLVSAVFLSISLLLSSCGKEEPAKPQYIEGVHYERYSGPASEEPTVTEFFWYGCSHCKSFAPLLEQWQQKHPKVTLQYQPVIWGEKSELHARLYHLLAAQANFDELHPQMFDHVIGFAQTDTVLDHQVALIRLLSEAGVSAIDTATALTDRQYDDAIATGLINQQQFGVSSTPTLVINQRYKVLNQGLNSLEDLLAVADWLLQQPITD